MQKIEIFLFEGFNVEANKKVIKLLDYIINKNNEFNQEELSVIKVKTNSNSDFEPIIIWDYHLFTGVEEIAKFCILILIGAKMRNEILSLQYKIFKALT